jgi:hypothetical protein
MSVGFHLLIKGATLDIVLDEGSHTGPPVITLDQFFSFKVARVSSGGVIVVERKDAATERSRHIGLILVEERTILEFPVRKGRFHGGST